MLLLNTYYRTGSNKTARIIYRDTTIFSNFNVVYPSLEIDEEDGVYTYLDHVDTGFYTQHEVIKC